MGAEGFDSCRPNLGQVVEILSAGIDPIQKLASIDCRFAMRHKDCPQFKGGAFPDIIGDIPDIGYIDQPKKSDCGAEFLQVCHQGRVMKGLDTEAGISPGLGYMIIVDQPMEERGQFGNQGLPEFLLLFRGFGGHGHWIFAGAKENDFISDILRHWRQDQESFRPIIQRD